MGYLVETSGRVLLPVDREGPALEALKAAMAGRQGWFDPDDQEWQVTSLADLASYAATSVTRDGGWVLFATDEEGDPKWSEQATAFYAELASWVSDGIVTLSGEDGMEWAYTYSSHGMTQCGTNGWDGSVEPFGEPVEEEEIVERVQERPERRGWFWRR